MHDVLVATDGSPSATAAVRAAVELAEAGHARLTLIAAVRPPAAWTLGALALLVAVPAQHCTADALLADAEHEAEGWLAAACEHVPADLPLTKLLAHGAPGKAILERARTGGHDVVVLGTGRHGATVRHVLRHARVPVLVVAADGTVAAHGAPQSTSVVP
jgi:nucleotide-binding universal stress UspA family protein